MSSLFHLQSIARTRDTLLKDIEGDTGVSNCIQKDMMLFPCLCYSFLNQLTIEASATLLGSSREANKMVY